MTSTTPTSTTPTIETRAGVEDIVFVGAGVSASYTLLGVLERLAEREQPTSEPLRITVVERSEDLFAGLAYGARSGPTSLVITTLKDFLAPTERAQFVTWLQARGEGAFDEFRAGGGTLTAQWLEANAAAIAAHDWDDLYLPRRLFGVYMRERLDAAIAAARQSGTADVRTVQGEARAVAPDGDRYAVTIDGAPEAVPARHVVLALGSLPSRAVTAQWASKPAVVIDDPYVPSMPRNVQRILAAADGLDHPAKVLLVGGNASIMELLYLLADRGGEDFAAAELYVLNPRGALPAQLTDPDPTVRFVPAALHALRGRAALTAQDIHDAAVADIETAERDGVAVGDSLGPIGEAMSELLATLDAAQQQAFAGYWAVEIGRRQRRSGVEYSTAARSLREDGRLRVIAGTFDPATGTVRTDTDEALPDSFDVVVNGSGSVPLAEMAADTLPGQLLGSGLCTTTELGRGLRVQDSFEAAPNLYVMGPLLAGNILRGRPIWHMEHCGRVESFSQLLADTLAERLAGG